MSTKGDEEVKKIIANTVGLPNKLQQILLL